MGKVDKFEDLKCWQEARTLVREIYQLFDNDSLGKEFVLRDQCQRAAISIMTNIAEGFSRFNRKDFIRFLDYSQSSAAELKSLLYIIEDNKIVEVVSLQKKSDNVRALVLGLIKYLKSTPEPRDSIKEPSSNYYLIDPDDKI